MVGIGVGKGATSACAQVGAVGVDIVEEEPQLVRVVRPPTIGVPSIRNDARWTATRRLGIGAHPRLSAGVAPARV